MTIFFACTWFPCLWTPQQDFGMSRPRSGCSCPSYGGVPGRQGALLRSSCWHYFFYLFFIQMRLNFTTELQVVLGTVQISSLYSEGQLGVFAFYCAANRSDFFVRGWSAPNTLRRMRAASVNICFASLFFPIASKTRPMFTLDVATSGGGLGRKL